MSRDPNIALKQMILGVEQRCSQRISELAARVEELEIKLTAPNVMVVDRARRKPGRPRKQDVEDRVLS